MAELVRPADQPTDVREEFLARGYVDGGDAWIMPKTELPRGEGADAPQGEVTGIALEYTEQNFNALVAANTAMQTEISALIEKIGLVDEIRETLKAGLKSERDMVAEQATVTRALNKRIQERETDVAYHSERADSLQRKLDRSLGYIDSVLDHKGMHRDRDGTPQMPSTVGPDLGAVPEAMRRGTDSEWAMPRLQPGTLRSSEYPAKRY